jgi:G3E family GTPase
VSANGELLRVEVASSVSAAAPPVHSLGDEAHASSVSTLELVTDETLDWQAFAAWLSLLLHAHGPDVLRVKGVLDVQHVGHVAINGVQHVVHRPEHVAGPVPPGTRLVLIVQGIDRKLIERSFHAFVVAIN